MEHTQRGKCALAQSFLIQRFWVWFIKKTHQAREPHRTCSYAVSGTRIILNELYLSAVLILSVSSWLLEFWITSYGILKVVVHHPISITFRSWFKKNFLWDKFGLTEHLKHSCQFGLATHTTANHLCHIVLVSSQLNMWKCHARDWDRRHRVGITEFPLDPLPASVKWCKQAS